MILSKINNFYDKGFCVQSQDILLKDFIANPIRVKDKMSAPLFNLSVRDSAQRSQLCVTGYRGLILDFDSGITIEEVCEDLKEYRFALYTSFSHRSEFHKFRVILPFSEILPASAYHTKMFKNAVSKRFKDVDPTTASPDRYYFVCCYTKDYRAVINNGKCWSPTEDKKFFSIYQEELAQQRLNDIKFELSGKVIPILFNGVQVATYGYEREEKTDKEWAKINAECKLEQMNFANRGSGLIHSGLCSLVGTLKVQGFSMGEISEILRPYECMAYRNEINQILRSFS